MGICRRDDDSMSVVGDLQLLSECLAMFHDRYVVLSYQN